MSSLTQSQGTFSQPLNWGQTMAPHIFNHDYSMGNCSSSTVYLGDRLTRDADGTLQSIPKSPAEVFGEYVISPLLDRVIDTLKGIDRFVSPLFNFIPVAKADDTGLIGWAENDCPDGWEEYTDLRGRVPVGAGYYIGITEDGRTEQVTYTAGDTGGEIDHTLNEGEMVAHEHRTGLSGGYAANTGFSRTNDNSMSVEASKWVSSQLYSSKEGGDQPHNNMQPYIVLKACQKTTSGNYASQSDVDALESNVNSLESDIGAVESDISTIQGSLSNYASQTDVDSIESDVSVLESDVSTIQMQVGNFKSDSCTITCHYTNSDSFIYALAIVGTISGIFGTIFGCMGMLGVRLNCSRNSEIAMTHVPNVTLQVDTFCVILGLLFAFIDRLIKGS